MRRTAKISFFILMYATLISFIFSTPMSVTTAVGMANSLTEYIGVIKQDVLDNILLHAHTP